MSSNPYLPKQVIQELNDQIEEKGFMPDEFLTSNKDLSVFGLNFAMGWPFPEEVKIKYEELARDLQKFDPTLYIYPYTQTHITIMTLVNFKEHQNPSKIESENIRGLQSGIVSNVLNLIENEESILQKPFTIDIGYPVLSSNAIFLPILNPTDEIERFRNKVENVLRERLNLTPQRPPGIHSTIARFYTKPDDETSYQKQFELFATDRFLGKAAINQILLTSEIKPYMRDGKILHRFNLSE